MFSSPVKVRFPYSKDDLVLLATHDVDPVSRWNAAQWVQVRLKYYTTVTFASGLPMLRSAMRARRTAVGRRWRATPAGGQSARR